MPMMYILADSKVKKKSVDKPWIILPIIWTKKSDIQSVYVQVKDVALDNTRLIKYGY